ncbi:AAA family ATPase [Verticiella sediminum]|uniref:DNA 3'-5' helicase n=1 Tax=Verticiella sediminum TaxID=1247510 RepID=A0A556ABN4_9BURK|nr:UvrD-helicase domain-containing protein [Verticiella sediminum]TSH90281.1 AAA family ATPase [Verticiella sediminum]
MLDNLNPPQRAAVTLEPHRHALVLAGAGSGKTRVLTTRMAWLLRSGQATPQSLLAVTFTNKAAREMLTRMSAMLPINARGMWIGTFHGLCNRMLRAHHRDAGLPATFQILDVADQLAAIKRLMKAANIDDEKYPPRQVQSYINSAKEEGLRAAAMQANDAFHRRLAEIYAMYEAQCQREGVVDFAELLLRSYELLQGNAPVREHYQRRFRHILVDEFQDTNTLQYRWLRMLAGGGAAVFAVGDDDQSIYAFRGANVGNMADFERDFEHPEVIRLEQNYRSHGHILDAANALIAHNDGRMGKNLWTDRGEGEQVRVVESLSDQAEAQWVVSEIQSLIAEGRARREIALLYRSNAQSRVLEHTLFSAGIPYKVYGGLRFFERQEIKHALAYLRLMENPHDDTAFIRVVNFPARGIGARTLENLTDAAQAGGTSLYGAVGRVAGKGGANLAQFVALIDRMRFETQNLPLTEVVAHVTAESGLSAHYKAEKEGAERLENLDELVNAAAAFDGETVMPEDGADALLALAAFLSHAALEAGDNQAADGQDAVQLMTIHAAKGLEFEAVFVTGLEEGLFPHENSVLEQAGLEEERRLMYVAITRARERLYLSFAQTRMLHGQTRYPMRSRFLDELPAQTLKWVTPKVSRVDAASYDRASAWRDSAWPERARPAPVSQGYAGASASQGVEVGGRHFRIGQTVSHARFGEGVILALQGSGPQAQAQIRFASAGTKTLALGVAKLETA